MEVLLNLPPLHLFTQYEARNQNYKLNIHESTYRNRLADQNLLNGYEDKLPVMAPSDHMTTKYNFDIPFKVEINDRSTWTNNEYIFPNEAILFYTDDSKTAEGSGSGIFEESTLGNRTRTTRKIWYYHTGGNSCN